MMDISFNIGGEAGQGIDTMGDLLTQVFVKAGFYTFTIKDYFSRIRGGYNFTQIRISDRPIHVHSDRIQFIIALTKKAISERRAYLEDDGVIIYDESLGVEEPEECHFAIPLEKIARDIGGHEQMANVAGLGCLLSILQFPLDLAGDVLSDIFGRKGKEVVQSNLAVAKAAYDYTAEHFKGQCKEDLASAKRVSSKRNLLITGNHGIALGALAANLKWISAYPMSPSTTVFQEIIKIADRFRVAAIQAEDEIAALCMAIGASFAGARSMVTTSGGGFSLMVESLGLAAMSETPVVIYNAQRPGPSTGLPTRTEQSDLLFMAFASQGEFPRIMLAPRDPAESFNIAARAFNLADRFQVPVMILGDQHLADSEKNIDRLDVLGVKIDRGKLDDADDGEYLRYELTEDGVSPRAFPGQRGKTIVSTGNVHDSSGHISENARIRSAMVEKFMKKVPAIKKVLEPPQFYGPEESDVTLLSWGSTWGAVNEVVESYHGDGKRLRQLHFSDLFPLKTEELVQAFEDSKAVITVEQNATGQFAKLVRMETGLCVDNKITRYDGRPISPQWVIRSLKEVGY